MAFLMKIQLVSGVMTSRLVNSIEALTIVRLTLHTVVFHKTTFQGLAWFECCEISK